jgi:hypothetical protein
MIHTDHQWCQRLIIDVERTGNQQQNDRAYQSPRDGLQHLAETEFSTETALSAETAAIKTA